jgi:hypothetical protein
MTDFKKGDGARIKGSEIEGEVVLVKFHEDTGARRVLFAWDNPEDPETFHEKWVDDADVNLVKLDKKVETRYAKVVEAGEAAAKKAGEEATKATKRAK